MTMNDTSWMQDAACLGADPRIFDPSTSKSKSGGTEWRAYCDNCPVRQACVQYAIDNEVEGYWGSTPAERAVIRSLVPQTVRLALYSVTTQYELAPTSSFETVEQFRSVDEVRPYREELVPDYSEFAPTQTGSTVLECIRALDDLLSHCEDLLR